MTNTVPESVWGFIKQPVEQWQFTVNPKIVEEANKYRFSCVEFVSMPATVDALRAENARLAGELEEAKALAKGRLEHAAFVIRERDAARAELAKAQEEKKIITDDSERYYRQVKYWRDGYKALLMKTTGAER